VSFENERIIISAHRFFLLQRYDFMAITQKNSTQSEVSDLAKPYGWRLAVSCSWAILFL